MNEALHLVGDIGGTNARFALANPDHPGYSNELNLSCADFAGVDQAIRFYLQQVDKVEPSVICLAVAGPIADQQVQLTNNPWFISSRDLSRQFSGAQVLLINDFTAIAFALPFLTDSDCLTIGPELDMPTDDQNYTVGVIGPGTGLGVAGLIKQDERYLPLISEAGHMGFAAESESQIRLLSRLLERWPRVSIERLISGPGVENIYWALNHLNAHPQASLNAAQIFQSALNDATSPAHQAVQIFFEILGQFAGDIALAFGAHDCMYIAGGMVKRYPQLLASSRFRTAFENKGRHQKMIATIPTKLILHPQPGLLGASYLAVNQ